MRLTSELIQSAPAYINPLRQRELGLRGYKLPVIENLGVTQDQYQAIDFSDNEITRLENFPLLAKLEAIFISNNRIARIAEGLGQFLPSLTTLILINNKLVNLPDLDPLSEFTKLENLSMIGNAVTKQPHYRLYVIHKLPKLRNLDFQKVKPKEREEAKKLFGELVSKNPTEQKAAQGAPAPKSKAVTIGTTISSSVPQLSDLQKAKLVDAIKNARNIEEVEKLEKMLTGVIPVQL